MPSPRVMYNTFARDVRAAYRYFKTLSYIKKCHLQNNTVIELFRNTARKNRDKVCFIFQDEEWTYQMVDEFSNKMANLFLSQGYKKGDEVALLMDNCPEYVCIWLGFVKIGVVTALLNTNQRGATLAHSVNVIDARAVIFSRDYSDILKEATPFFDQKDTLDFYCYSRDEEKQLVLFPAKSLNALLEEASPEPISPQKMKAKFSDKMLYIYTSGTTGLPKAAIISHNRFLWISAAAQFISNLKDHETIYNTLPMYHTAGGIVFISVMMVFGGKMVVRKKFSASNFWKDAIQHKVTVAQYIGEICRYLLNQPITEEETKHSVRLFFGNGLRPHIWKEFQDRFNIKLIIEIYGSTEGNANLVNMFGKVGAVGFLPRVLNRLYPVYLVRVDPETNQIMRNSKGLCIRCKPGEPGELVGKIISNPINSFDGYANKSETRKKIIRDCFDKGDMAFLSGDILVMDELGYLSFVDRTGDTFRWRGENVSTNEVENVMSKALNHSSCVVYGVEIPNTEGRAGMAAVQINVEKVNLSELHDTVCKALPRYAIPMFIRITSEIESTGTHKLRKVSLQKEGYNPEQISDPLFFFDAAQHTYVPLTKELHTNIVTGKIKL